MLIPRILARIPALIRVHEYVCTRVLTLVGGFQPVPTYHLPGCIQPIELYIVRFPAGLSPHLRDLRSRNASDLGRPFALIGVGIL